MIAEDITISDEAFAGLVHQRGALWDLREDRPAWEAAYRRDLARAYHAMAPILPDLEAPSILDIGAGMGGLDLLLWRHYDQAARLTLLDGVGLALEPATHDAPFGDLARSAAFLVENGVAPAALSVSGSACALGGVTADLVISTRAWGFHFAPRPYLDWAMKAARPGAVFVLDIRRQHPWLAEFIAALGHPTYLLADPKSHLVAFRLGREG